eukprot:5674629-Pyramimonas_sp.AAC.1
MQAAVEKATKARTTLAECADAVLTSERKIEAIQQEGNAKQQRGIFEQLLDADLDLLSPSDVQIEAVEKEFEYEADMDAEGRRAVQEAKKNVLGQVQQNTK